jgi:hypothetical protein
MTSFLTMDLPSEDEEDEDYVDSGGDDDDDVRGRKRKVPSQRKAPTKKSKCARVCGVPLI